MLVFNSLLVVLSILRLYLPRMDVNNILQEAKNFYLHIFSMLPHISANLFQNENKRGAHIFVYLQFDMRRPTIGR